MLPAALAAQVLVPTRTLAPGVEGPGLILSGSLQAVQQVTVSAQTAGNVLSLAVKAGDRVKLGQPLARIDERSADAALRASSAGVEQAEAQLVNSRQQAERSRDLRRQGFISQAAVDSAEAQLRAALAAVDQARALGAQSALARSLARVTAPLDGVVLATHVEAGDLAMPGKPLLTLYAPGRLRAVVDIPASRMATARQATRVEVQLPDGRWITPTSRTDLPSADPVSQTVEWRLELPAAQLQGLAPGLAVQVRFAGAGAVAGGSPTRLRLPPSAVLQRGELSAVYVVQDGRFQLRPVRLGEDFGAAGIEVLAGLKPGERFAVDAVRAGLSGAAPAR
jgi:RND family efflux transporter MFP subunit